MDDLETRARVFATAAHARVGQKRKYTGEPYITHPAAVAELVRGTRLEHEVSCMWTNSQTMLDECVRLRGEVSLLKKARRGTPEDRHVERARGLLRALLRTVRQTRGPLIRPAEKLYEDLERIEHAVTRISETLE